MKKTECPISNTEYPMSKWAVTRMGVPVLRGTEMKSCACLAFSDMFSTIFVNVE